MKRVIIEQYKAFTTQKHLHSSRARYVLYGGAMGGGKSWGGVAEDFRLSWKYPGNRGVIVRKNMTTLRRTILKTFFQLIPSELIEDWNKQEMKVTLINGSEILFMEADISKDQLFDKFKSLEIGWFHMEEASEMDKTAFQILGTRLRWRLPNGKYPFFRGILTTNPEDCWLKDDFIENPLRNTVFIPSLPRDNPYLPAGYVAELRDILSDDQQERYLEGKWETSDKPDQLISFQWLRDAIGNFEDIEGEDYTLGGDVARFGDDSSVIAVMLGNALIELKEYPSLRTDQFADKIEKTMKHFKVEPQKTGVDVIGLGAGTVDSLRRRNIKIKEINSSAKAPEYGKYQFKNFRSFMWWLAREDFRNGKICLLHEDKELMQELAAVRYKISAEKTIEIEPKKETKKRLKRSPDKADAFIYANALRHEWNKPKIFKYVSLIPRRNKKKRGL